MIRAWHDLEPSLRSRRRKPVVGVVCAQDRHSLEAIREAQEKGLIRSVLIGDEGDIRRLIRTIGMAENSTTILPQTGDEGSAREAVRLARQGEIDTLMKGKIQTRDFLKAVVDSEKGIKDKDALLSHAAVLEVPGYPKLLGITDGGMVPTPDLEAKKAILANGVSLFHRLGCARPKVAVLAAVETVNPKMPETVDAAALKENSGPDCLVEGPISYDLAFSRESALLKGYHSEVTGDVDLLVVPDIASGNILSKALIYSAGATMAGVVMGAAVPIVLTSRGSSAAEKYNSLLLSTLCGKEER